MLQLINIAICWLFFGVLNAHFAKKRGKNQLLWFALGTLFGVVALAILFLLPTKRLREGSPLKHPSAKTQPKATLPPMRTEAHLKHWYYLDGEHKQIGPMEFTDLTKVFKEKGVGKESFIWSEGMSEWKQLHELPDVEQELSAAPRP